MNEIKVYVAVEVNFHSDGIMISNQITWEDGHKYDIDRVTNIQQAAAMKDDGQGDRYTVWINGRQNYFFLNATTRSLGTISDVSSRKGR